MNKPLSLALFGGGCAAILRLAATAPWVGSASPKFGDALTGTAAWLLLAGAVVAAAASVIPARLQPLTTN